MRYVKVSGDIVVEQYESEHAVCRAFPATAFPAELGDVSAFGVYPLAETERPPHDPLTQDLVETLQRINGAWTSTWQAVDVSPEEAQVRYQATVPQVVSRAQGKAVLIQMGLWAQVVAFVDAIEDATQKALAQVALYDTVEWRRDSAFLATAAAALNINEQQLDAMFIAAAQIVF